MLTSRFSTLFRATLFKPRACGSTILQNGYSTKPKNKGGYKLLPGDVDIVVNPDMTYWKSFMTTIGAEKTNFKLSDHYIWKETIKDDYKMVFFCLKGTKKVIACYKAVMQRPLPSHAKDNVDSVFFGFMYVMKEYRGTDILKAVDTQRIKDIGDTKNVVVYCTDESLNFWMRMAPESKVSFDLNRTYYKGENVKIPKPPLVFDDIIVKSAHDVPDDDITKYDQSIYPFERREYMLRHLRDPVGFGKVAYDRDGKVIGFGTITVYPSGDGTIFPLYVDNDRVAQAIFQECLKEVEEDGIKLKNVEARMPVVEGFDNTSWMKPFLTHEPSPLYLAHHLYSSQDPKGLDFKKIYCVTFPSLYSI